MRHYVLVDLEWIENRIGHSSPTQLAAMRVDENWNPIQIISTFIIPQNSSFHDWKHVAFSGGKAENFLTGRSAYHAIEYFEKWLQPEKNGAIAPTARSFSTTSTEESTTP